MNFEDLFHIEAAKAKNLFGEETLRRLQKSLDDFNAVIEGKYPIHAEVDKDVPLPTDGGTTFYKSDGYKLTIVMSLNGIMRGEEYVHGYIYGPILSFEPGVMTGNFPNIQHLTFYTGEELQKILRRMSD
jgi:hypothetical protein